MANQNQVIGRAKVKIDGILIATGKGNTVLEPGGTFREGVEGDYITGSFKESAKDSKLTFSALTNASFSAAAFGNITDATISIEFDTGRSWIIRHGYSEGPPPIKADGTADCVIMGPAAQEVK
ncbi:MAG: phage tail tube protein [Sphingomonas sp.]